MNDARAEEHELVARVSQGDRAALETLYWRHAPWLTRRLEARCSDPDLVDIAVQDTFVTVWRSAKRYRADGDVGAWIWGIGVRRLVDQLRRRSPDPVPADQLVATTLALEDGVLESGVHGPLASALRALHPDLAAVLVLTALDGLTTREAAAVLHIPQGTVKTRLRRARIQMQEALA